MVANTLPREPATLSLIYITHDWRVQFIVEYSKYQHACEIFDGTFGDDRYKVMD